MKLTIIILFLFGISSSVFAEKKEVKTSPDDLVCKRIKFIAGDNSKVVKFIESMYNNGEESIATPSIIKCENSTSICYSGSGGNTLTCHKK